MKPPISPEHLKDMVSYNGETGQFVWLERGGVPHWWNARYAGTPAFENISSWGYRRARIHGKQVFAHRAAWAIVHGRWPEHEIDHINGDKLDNRISNLRDVPRIENARNQRRYSTNKSGYGGVCYAAHRGLYMAYISDGKKQVTLGFFKSLEDAVECRKVAKENIGYQPSHGAAFCGADAQRQQARGV